MISIKNVILPNKPLSNFELENAVRKLKIPYFRGVFLLDTLPKKLNKKECGIVNFDKSGGSGTHWVAWYKNGKTKIYFDSYGVQPPLEVIKYLGSPIHYNTDQLLPAGEVFCGHSCLYVSSVYLGILGQLFYPIFPHFSSFFLKIKIQDHFSNSLKHLKKKQHRYIIQLHHHHMIYLTNSYKSSQLNSISLKSSVLYPTSKTYSSPICSIKATNYFS